MNTDQLQSIFRTLLAAGGPIAGLLTNAGLKDGTVANILTIAVIVLPPLVSVIWGYIEHNHHNTIAAAAAVPGVTAINIAPLATDGAAAAAADVKLPTVNKVIS